MSSYQNEQTDALRMVRGYLETLSDIERQKLKSEAADYLDFRRDVQTFLKEHFSSVCTLTCFHSRRSACCSREGIITFFADVVINALVSDPDSLDRLEAVLETENNGFKCIYLDKNGCLWQMKPIVCEMFLCDVSQTEVFGTHSPLKAKWDELQERRKRFTWPDKPILFDSLEKRFMDAGLRSTLMYLHNSPGLLRIKKQWQQHDPSESS
ncbi:MAG: hypothetical protein P1P89_12735 [Desulfobacterales bacterium]|nr:hypothetical protein [Desulfobacterales bacterium]